MSALVLKKFYANPQPAKPHEFFVHVIGREAGIMAWLLSLANIDPVTELRVMADRVVLKQSSFFGSLEHTIPLTAICGVFGGYTKPKWPLFAGGVLMSMASMGALGSLIQGEFKAVMGALFLGAIGALFLFVYWLGKRLTINVQNGGDALYGLTFKSSIIEGVSVNEKAVLEAVGIINLLVSRTSGAALSGIVHEPVPQSRSANRAPREVDFFQSTGTALPTHEKESREVDSPPSAAHSTGSEPPAPVTPSATYSDQFGDFQSPPSSSTRQSRRA